ncbi:MAG: S49 family peptidase [Verrucomicrobia bacterium]|nr:S49 family peptidase [Verrucomicrobiota bacterium]
MYTPRESIIVSAIRSFCTSFAAIIGVLIGLILVLVCLMFFSTPDIFPARGQPVISADAKGGRDLLPPSAPVVLKLNFMGVIGLGDLTSDKVESLLLDSREGMLGSRVKAVLLYMNTPGGAADDADAIYRALKRYKEEYKVPIYAFVDGLCASGGMYIASAADQIFATPSSIIGSVGVILGPTFNYSGLMERYGVQSLALTEGKDKDMLSPFRPWRPGEDASLRAITAGLYEQFVSIVSEARPKLTRQKLVEEYGAQIYISKVAKEYGYIDHDGANYSTALAALTDAAGIPSDQHYQVFTLEPPHTLLSDLSQINTSLLKGKITHQFQIGPFMNSELSGRFLYLYQPAME